MNCIDSVTVPFFLKGRVLPYATACAACVPNTALKVLRVVAVVRVVCVLRIESPLKSFRFSRTCRLPSSAVQARLPTHTLLKLISANAKPSSCPTAVCGCFVTSAPLFSASAHRPLRAAGAANRTRCGGRAAGTRAPWPALAAPRAAVRWSRAAPSCSLSHASNASTAAALSQVATGTTTAVSACGRRRRPRPQCEAAARSEEERAR